MLRALLVAIMLLGCEGAEGPIGPEGTTGAQGAQGPTANIAHLEAKVDSLNAVIEFILGGKAEDSGPLALGDTELRILSPVTTFLNDVTFEIENL